MSRTILAGDDAAFQGLIDSFDDAGAQFKTNLQHLDSLMADAQGALKGTIGDALKKLYTDNKEDFERLSKTIKESGDYTDEQKTGFDNLVEGSVDAIGRG